MPLDLSQNVVKLLTLIITIYVAQDCAALSYIGYSSTATNLSKLAFCFTTEMEQDMTLYKDVMLYPLKSSEVVHYSVTPYETQWHCITHRFGNKH